jgi:hypothetical protein
MPDQDTMPSVLKKSQVRLAPEDSEGPGAAAPAARGARARILSDGPDGAVIEVTCPCGQKTQVRCLYAPAPAGGAQ